MYLNKVKIKTSQKEGKYKPDKWFVFTSVCFQFFFLFLLKYEVLWIIYLKLDFKIAVKNQ